MKRLLVVVDMQNDFIDGSLGTLEALNIVPKVKKKIDEYMASDDEVVFTLDTHEENYMETQEGKNLPVLHCVRGSNGWELHNSLKNYKGKRFEKNTFGSEALGEFIKDKGYDSIELIGLCTDICVISNALLLKAFEPEIPLRVDSSCCAGVTPESHDNALNAMKICHIEVI